MGKPNPQRLKLSQLRALVAIADVGSFSEAALQLELSQSAVSHAIATLEEELGVVLFSRGRQGAHLTSVGEQIAADARLALGAVERICQSAQQARGLQGGEVRIAAFRSVATHILPEVIRQFHQRHPDIAIVLEEYPNYRLIEDELRQGRVDVGFTYMPANPSFEVWELLREPYIVLLPPTSAPVPHPFTWDDLAAYPLILGPHHEGDRENIETHLARWGRAIPPAYVVREDSTILGMVQRGLGATIMAQLAAQPIPPGVRQVALPLPLERVIAMVVRRDALLPPSVYAFLDTLKATWTAPHPSVEPATD